MQILRELHASCAPSDDGADVDSSKGTLQLEVYALEIQMYSEAGNNKKLRVSTLATIQDSVVMLTSFLSAALPKEIYEKSGRVRSAIPHPRIQGVLRECGGKMYMSESEYLCPITEQLLKLTLSVLSQRIGLKHKWTSSRASETTTKLDLRRGSRC